MKIIDVRKLSYEYVRTNESNEVVEKTQALQDLDLQIEEGSFVCVLGHNGSGKSTFAKLLNGLHLPAGGTVLVSGRDTRDLSEIWNIRRETGMVFQNPDNQIIASVVEEDVGFGPENIGIPTAEIWSRVERALEAVGMTAYRLRSPNKLSGGQKQRVAIAGTMAMLPRCIVLDEPTAMLDPNGRAEVVRTVHWLNQQQGVTILLITHYMEEAADADRILLMDKGRLVMDGTPQEVFSEAEKLLGYRMALPQVTELAFRLRQKGMPLAGGILHRADLVGAVAKAFSEKGFSVADRAETAERSELGAAVPKSGTADVADAKARTLAAPANADNPDRDDPAGGAADADFSGTGEGGLKDGREGQPAGSSGSVDAVIKAEGLSYVYQQGTAMENYALKKLDFSIRRGAVTALIGHTGSGKSTLVQHLNGLLRGSEGKILVKFRQDIPGNLPKDAEGYTDIYAEGFPMKELRFKVGLVFQYPEYQLFETDVLRDVMFGPKNQGLSETEAERRAQEALRMAGLPEELWQKSPFALSGGQKRRAAIAGVLAMQPEVLVLDEPTAGLDPRGREELFQQIDLLHKEQGMSILLVSHSMEDVAQYADDVLVFSHGELKMQGTPREVFGRYGDLEALGLSAPEMCYVMRDLQASGLPFGNVPGLSRPGAAGNPASLPLTVQEAADTIYETWRGIADVP